MKKMKRPSSHNAVRVLQHVYCSESRIIYDYKWLKKTLPKKPAPRLVLYPHFIKV